MARSTRREVEEARSPQRGVEPLKRQTDSALEREWLDLIDAHGLALPTHAQKLIESCACRPDFLYAPDYLAVFIDGPVHDDPSQATLDRQQQDCLEDMGYQALRFRYDDKDRWLDQLAEFPSVFGEVP